MTEAFLDNFERQSAVWLRLKEHYEARLAMLRAKNDGNLDTEETAKVRGRIAEIKELLLLDKDPMILPSDSDKFKD